MKTVWLILAVAIAIVAAKAIVTVEESLIIAIAIMTIGSIDYDSNTITNITNWLVLTGTMTMFFSLFGSALPGSAFPLCYVILVLLGVITFVIIASWTKLKPNGIWMLNRKKTTIWEV